MAANLQAAFDLGGVGLQAAALATAGQRREKNRIFMVMQLE
jgi:hypothetical protein